MEEALDALQAEREAKYAIKKDLDARINSESMFNLSNLAYSIKGSCQTNFALIILTAFFRLFRAIRRTRDK
jgi:protein bicaudal D